MCDSCLLIHCWAPGAAARGPWQSAGPLAPSSWSPSLQPRRVHIRQKSVSCSPGVVGRQALPSGGWSSLALSAPSSQGDLSAGDVLWGLPCGIITSPLFWTLGCLASLRCFGGRTLMEIMEGSRGGARALRGLPPSPRPHPGSSLGADGSETPSSGGGQGSFCHKMISAKELGKTINSHVNDNVIVGRKEQEG